METNTTQKGIALLGSAFLALFTLSATGFVAMPWWLVSMPLWMGLPVLFLWVFIGVLLKQKYE